MLTLFSLSQITIMLETIENKGSWRRLDAETPDPPQKRRRPGIMIAERCDVPALIPGAAWRLELSDAGVRKP
jgi:hypothetical protein